MASKSLTELVALGTEALVPSSFYRSQHPDLFSDSKEERTTSLPQDLFAFHLDQLTTTKREREFEDFARRLCEREICPNLLTQTGPTGGGDSKTDSSTYPVAPELGMRRWWVGHTSPSDEDWAFAFSCKHDWRTKVKDDIAKIASLPRQFARAYFVTNQPVKDKARAELEDKLRTQHGLDVRILDRTWIIERVHTNQHEVLAIDSLGLQIGQSSEKRLGPQDTHRTPKLETLLAKLRQDTIPTADDYVLAQDYLAAAKLASSLERPRDETDALFLRSRDLAIASGHLGLIVRTHYTHAWRTFFWFDDPAGTERILELLLPRIPEIQDAELLELLVNLCSVLHTASIAGVHKCEETILVKRRNMVETHLQRLVADKSRPNNSLHAETLLVSSDNTVSRSDKKQMEVIFKKLGKLFRRADGMGTYPIFHFMDVWQKSGELYCDWPGYADLQSEMQAITAKRFGETEAGNRQIEFGWQLLDKKKLPEALTQLSAARFLLSKEETIDQSISAALGCAAVYKQMGHAWAARSETLVAAQFALGSMEKFHEYPSRAYHCAVRMSWIELELGRLAPFLAWRNLTSILCNKLADRGDANNKYLEDLENQDAGLGCLFLKAPIEEVRNLEELADTLDQMGLHIARMCLLHTCGRDVESIDEKLSKHVSVDQLSRYLNHLRTQPIFEQLPPRFSNDIKAENVHSVRLLGVDFRFRSENKLGATLVSESVIAMIDAALALAKLENFAIVYDQVSISIKESNTGHCPPSPDPFLHSALEELEQIWGANVVEWIHTHRQEFSRYLTDLLGIIIATITIDPMKDIRNEMKAWAKAGVFSRALLSADASMALLDIVGGDCYDMKSWISKQNDCTPP
jgi:hypothetical protein